MSKKKLQIQRKWIQSKEGPSQNKDQYFILNWISHVSSLKTPKDMFNAMANFYEGKNINKNMILRKQLKDVNTQMSKII